MFTTVFLQFTATSQEKKGCGHWTGMAFMYLSFQRNHKLCALNVVSVFRSGIDDCIENSNIYCWIFCKTF